MFILFRTSYFHEICPSFKLSVLWSIPLTFLDFGVKIKFLVVRPPFLLLIL